MGASTRMLVSSRLSPPVDFLAVKELTFQTPGRGESRPLEGQKFAFDLRGPSPRFENVADVLIQALDLGRPLVGPFGRAIVDGQRDAHRSFGRMGFASAPAPGRRASRRHE